LTTERATAAPSGPRSDFHCGAWRAGQLLSMKLAPHAVQLG
jgi:hypothetical protein